MMEAVGRSGTLTFLFTDIESSTSLWDRFPAAMANGVQACAFTRTAGHGVDLDAGS